VRVELLTKLGDAGRGLDGHGVADEGGEQHRELARVVDVEVVGDQIKVLVLRRPVVLVGSEHRGGLLGGRGGYRWGLAAASTLRLCPSDAATLAEPDEQTDGLADEEGEEVEGRRARVLLDPAHDDLCAEIVEVDGLLLVYVVEGLRHHRDEHVDHQHRLRTLGRGVLAARGRICCGRRLMPRHGLRRR